MPSAVLFDHPGHRDSRHNQAETSGFSASPTSVMTPGV